MFKSFKMSLASLALGLFSGFAFAHDHGEGKMGGDIATKKEQCKSKTCCKSQSMIATADGGVIILCGKSLMKYDKNLKLVKEVEVECTICCKKGGDSADSDGHCARPGNKEDDKVESDEKKAPATPTAPPAKK